MMCRQAIFLILFMIPLAMVTRPAEARAPARDHTIYYRIGGANTVRPPENAFATTTSIPASAEIGLRYSCGQFDPLAGLLTGAGLVGQVRQTARGLTGRLLVRHSGGVGGLGRGRLAQ